MAPLCQGRYRVRHEAWFARRNKPPKDAARHNQAGYAITG